MIFDALQSCDDELQNECVNAIVLSGGNTLIKGN
jgi:actin-related protein